MSSELQLGVRCLSCCGGDIWRTLTKERHAWCYLQVKLGDPCLSALSVPPWPKKRYINTLPFLSFTRVHGPCVQNDARFVYSSVHTTRVSSVFTARGHGPTSRPVDTVPRPVDTGNVYLGLMDRVFFANRFLPCDAILKQVSKLT